MFIVSIYHPHLKLVAHTELLFPKSLLRAEELNNPIGKSVKPSRIISNIELIGFFLKYPC